MKKNGIINKKAAEIMKKYPGVKTMLGAGAMAVYSMEETRRMNDYAADKFMSIDSEDYRKEIEELNAEYSKKLGAIRRKYIDEYSKKGINATEKGIEMIQQKRRKVENDDE